MPSAPSHEDDERQSLAQQQDSSSEEPLCSSSTDSQRPFKPYPVTDADVQHYHEKLDEGDLIDEEGRRSPTKSEMAEADLPMLTPGQRRLGHCYFGMQLVISVCNLCCFILKLPFLVFIIRAALEVIKMKQMPNPTFAPPYGKTEGMFHANDPTTTPTSANGFGNSTAAKAEIICLLLLYVAMLVIHLDVGCVLFCSSKCKGYLHLVVYYPLVAIWLFLCGLSYFVTSWPYALNYIILVFKLLIHGNHLTGAPRTWELNLLRASIIVDTITFLLTITYTILAIIWRRKRLPPHSVHNWKPHYNLIRLL